MLVKETKLCLLDLFSSFVEEERDLESTRQNLCQTPSFEPYLAFRRIDISNSGFLIADSISNFLSKFNFFHNPTKIQCYVNHYDQDFDQRLSYSEFLQSVLPQDNTDLRFEISQRPIKRPEELEQAIIEEIEKKLAYLLNREILFYIKFERQKRNLLKSADFDLNRIFSCLAIRSKDEIGFEDLKVFFLKGPHEMSDSEIVLLLRRVDLNGDGKISFLDFENAFSPQSKYSDEKPNKPATSLPREKSPDEGRSRPIKEERKEFHSNYSSLSNFNTQKSLKAFKNKGLDEQISEIVELMLYYLKIERNHEELKQELAMMDDFNLFDLFRAFDKERRGFVLPNELEIGLNEIQLHPGKEEMMVLVANLSAGNDGKIKFSNFINVFLPKQTEYANILNKRTPGTEEKPFNALFRKKTRSLIRKVIETTIQNEVFLENQRAKLVNSPFFNVERIFDYIDYDNDGFISLYDVSYWLFDPLII